MLCHQGPVFDFYVTGSLILAVVVAEEFVDGVDVDQGKEVATFSVRRLAKSLMLSMKGFSARTDRQGGERTGVGAGSSLTDDRNTRCVPQNKCGKMVLLPVTRNTLTVDRDVDTR